MFDINTATLTELQAEAYKTICMINVQQNNLNLLQQKMAEVSQQPPTAPVAVTPDVVPAEGG